MTLHSVNLAIRIIAALVEAPALRIIAARVPVEAVAEAVVVRGERRLQARMNLHEVQQVDLEQHRERTIIYKMVYYIMAHH